MPIACALLVAALLLPGTSRADGATPPPRPVPRAVSPPWFHHVEPKVQIPATDPSIFSTVHRSPAWIHTGPGVGPRAGTEGTGAPARSGSGNDSTALQAARRDAWEGRLVAAAAEFRALVARAPGNPDLHGELGNVLWQAGRYREALAAYADTVTLLVKSGRSPEAEHLVQEIARVDPRAAQKLAQRLQPAAGKAAPTAPN